MTWNVWQQFIELNGNPVAGASVEVRKMSDNSLVSLASDAAGSVLTNPFNTDPVGFARFYAQAGSYKITASVGASSFSFTNVLLGDAAGYDVGVGGLLDKASADTLYATVRKYNVDDTAPLPANDITQGYTDGSQWLRPASGELYQLFDEVTGDWRLIDTGLTNLGTMSGKDEGTGATEFRNNQDAEAYFASQAGLDGIEAALQADIDAKVTDAPIDGKTYSRKDAAWVETTGGGGLSADVAETINEPWDFQSGVTASGVKIGQDVTVDGVGTFKAPFSYVFSNASEGGTIDIQNSEVIAGSDADSLAIYRVKNSDFSLWNVGDLYTHYDMELFDANTGDSLSYQHLSVVKTATGVNVAKGIAITDGGNNGARLNFAIVDGSPSLSVRKEFGNSTNYEIPIDGRINTKEVTASRALTNADVGQIIIVTGSADVTLTIPAGLQTGFKCRIKNQTTANTVNVVDDGTSSINNKDNQLNIELNGHAEILPRLGTDTYDLVGDTVV